MTTETRQYSLATLSGIAVILKLVLELTASVCRPLYYTLYTGLHYRGMLSSQAA